MNFQAFSIGFLLLLSTTGPVRSQTFIKVYGTSFDRTARDVVKLADGYLITGVTNNSNQADSDLLLMKTDLDGNAVATYTFGGGKPDYAYSIITAHDGNFIIAGWSQSFSGGDADIYLLKVTATGSVVWEKTFLGFGNEEAREVIKCSAGGYVVVGQTNSNLPDQQIFALWVDESGVKTRIKYYGGTGLEFGNSIKECSDGGFVIGGQTFSYGSAGDAYLIKTNSGGDTVWTRHFGAGIVEEVVSVEVNSDNSSVIAVRDSTAGRDIDVDVYKFDVLGNQVWMRNYGAAKKDTPKTIRKTSDGGFIVGAISRSWDPDPIDPKPDMWIMKLNSNGYQDWAYLYGQYDHEHCHMAKEDNGKVLAVGHSKSNYSVGPNQKVMFMRLNADGNVGVVKTADSEEIVIYPNPCVNKILHVKTASSLKYAIKISDISGRVVKNIYIDHMPELQMDLTDLQAGMYLLTASDGYNAVSHRIILE
jgi:hypothetical protein